MLTRDPSGAYSVGNVNAGILFIFSLTSIGVYGISLAGWASGSKFPLLGSVRSTAQMISYELSMSMSVIDPLFCHYLIPRIDHPARVYRRLVCVYRERHGRSDPTDEI